MFITHSTFKHPMQFDRDTTNWSCVEVGLATPWFIATLLNHEEGVQRDFLLLQEDLLLSFTKMKGESLVALQLVRPPTGSSSDSWTVTPLVKVQRPTCASNSMEPLFLSTEDGIVFTGFPLKPADGVPSELQTCWICPSPGQALESTT